MQKRIHETGPPSQEAKAARISYRVDELADALGISRRTVERACGDGRLISTKKLGVRLIQAESVKALFGEDATKKVG